MVDEEPTPVPPAGQPGVGRKPRLTAEEKDDVARRYAAGESSGVLAREHGRDRSAILYIVRGRGIAVRGPDRTIPSDHKRCPACKRVKPRATDFYLATLLDGTVRASSRCRTCDSADRKKPAVREWYRKDRERIRREMAAAYGGACACCGESAWEFLTIDHTEGGGHQHRKSLKRKGADFYVWLRRQGWPKDAFRLLCFNCNLALGFYGFCHGAPPVPVPVPGPQASKADRVRHSARVYCRRLRADMLRAYGGRCACCGEGHPQFLALDHVNGGGSAERKRVGLVSLLQRLKREGWPKGEHRLLCHDCNAAWGILHRCPHAACPPCPPLDTGGKVQG